MFDLALPHLQEKGQAVLKQARAIFIFDQADYDEAAAFAATCQTALKTIEAKRAELKKPVVEQGRAIDQAAKELAAPFLEAKEIAQGQCVAFMREQEAKRREAERKAREEAEAERKRLEAEAQKLAAAAEISDTVEEQIEAENKAAELKDQARQVAAVVPVYEVPQTNANLSIRRAYKCTVTDLGAFVRYIADHCEQNPNLLNFVKVDLPKVNKFVTATSNSIALGGVAVTIEEKAVSRSRAPKADVIEG